MSSRARCRRANPARKNRVLRVRRPASVRLRERPNPATTKMPTRSPAIQTCANLPLGRIVRPETREPVDKSRDVYSELVQGAVNSNRGDFQDNSAYSAVAGWPCVSERFRLSPANETECKSRRE